MKGWVKALQLFNHMPFIVQKMERVRLAQALHEAWKMQVTRGKVEAMLRFTCMPFIVQKMRRMKSWAKGVLLLDRGKFKPSFKHVVAQRCVSFSRLCLKLMIVYCMASCLLENLYAG